MCIVALVHFARFCEQVIITKEQPDYGYANGGNCFPTFNLPQYSKCKGSD